MVSRTATILGISVITAGLISGCGGMEENPLNVNGAPESAQGVTVADAPDAVVVPAPPSEDPLQLGANGAKLCSVEPALGYQEYTVLIHNETLESFTVDDVSLGSPSGVTMNSAEVTPANRGGHGTHGMADGTVMGGGGEHTSAHGAGEMAAMEEMPENVFFTEPVPAIGYEISTLEYLNVVVSVSIDEGAERGTSEYVEIDYSTAEGSFTGQHPLAITMDRESCA
ncbi:hypothetical protein [Arthrobacter sp. H20]|uniref:hypothetical protein n=1 Tax=Arthrobacter sp. H20 TaxID=1267981 RepID=UPI00047E20BF|nr:hypothetical protein [Arthrobacter sp. H20]